MANFAPSLLPDVLLGVEVRASRRVIQEFQMRVLGQKLVDRWAEVPGSAIQQQEQMWSRKEHDDQAQKVCGDGGGLFVSCDSHLTTSDQVKHAIEMHVVALRAHFDDRRLPFGSPHSGESGLKVQAHLVHGEYR